MTTYLGVPLSRWKNDMVCHLRDERERNRLLQQRLDDANAMIARLQVQQMPPTRFEQFRRKSHARMRA